MYFFTGLEFPVKLDSFPTDNQMKDGGPLYSAHDSDSFEHIFVQY